MDVNKEFTSALEEMQEQIRKTSGEGWDKSLDIKFNSQELEDISKKIGMYDVSDFFITSSLDFGTNNAVFWLYARDGFSHYAYFGFGVNIRTKEHLEEAGVYSIEAPKEAEIIIKLLDKRLKYKSSEIKEFLELDSLVKKMEEIREEVLELSKSYKTIKKASEEHKTHEIECNIDKCYINNLSIYRDNFNILEMNYRYKKGD
jgi:hypothetical protein